MKIVIITGGSRGLGASTTIECARNGMGVIVTYNNNPGKADEVVEAVVAGGGTAAAQARCRRDQVVLGVP